MSQKLAYEKPFLNPPKSFRKDTAGETKGNAFEIAYPFLSWGDKKHSRKKVFSHKKHSCPPQAPQQIIISSISDLKVPALLELKKELLKNLEHFYKNSDLKDWKKHFETKWDQQYKNWKHK